MLCSALQCMMRRQQQIPARVSGDVARDIDRCLLQRHLVRGGEAVDGTLKQLARRSQRGGDIVVVDVKCRQQHGQRLGRRQLVLGDALDRERTLATPNSSTALVAQPCAAPRNDDTASSWVARDSASSAPPSVAPLGAVRRVRQLQRRRREVVGWVAQRQAHKRSQCRRVVRMTGGSSAVHPA